MSKQFLHIKNIQKKDIIILFILIFILFLGTYLYTNKYLWLQRSVYYSLQKPFAIKTIKCSHNSPAFMNELTYYVINEQNSMNNQLAYRDEHGQLHHCESGWEDGFRGEQPITVDSRFRYASVSKVVTSAMVLHLANQGKLSLDQKLLDIIEIPEPKDSRIKKITVAMLLEHSAGFDRLKTYTPMLTAGKKPWCPTKINELSNVQLDFEPNTQFQYSNIGYCLLGAVVEKITNKTFRQAVEDVYKISSKQIKFIDNDFLAEEIQYDYRFENFYTASYRNKFDFKDSLSAVGGLSGSAKAITLLTSEMLLEKPLNILSRNHSPCAINLIGGCYGYALLPYESHRSGRKDFYVYMKDGYFPGVETDLFIDDKNRILTIFRGATAEKYEDKENLRKLIYNILENN